MFAQSDAKCAVTITSESVMTINDAYAASFFLSFDSRSMMRAWNEPKRVDETKKHVSDVCNVRLINERSSACTACPSGDRYRYIVFLGKSSIRACTRAHSSARKRDDAGRCFRQLANLLVRRMYIYRRGWQTRKRRGRRAADASGRKVGQPSPAYICIYARIER